MNEDMLNVMGSFISTELDAFENLYKELEEKGKEIERLTAESTEWESKYYDMQDNYHNANEEIGRLNNIINELEKYIKESCWKDDWGVESIYVKTLLNKLQELKGEDKK